MNSKVFSQRFNQELSSLGFPDDPAEKTKAVAKVFAVNRHLANSMILGYSMPPADKLDGIARILEVCPKWLAGESARKKGYPVREMEEA
ncbi:hypothetical protein Lgee_1973 [Legionella geestiana]|uniref:Uncharacterized protein n=1 Tax=Legionella geestiana TaxID=45065 RepID=A0A0W0TNZ0_9GAMM|nr:hypothetical protein [Legionella geestiana]KTC97312.1 hypothetical protein Lgee_1973 [Legionella geestiana]QBS12439.1 hypothetical protein E4T54_06575 [Legionella geestiana]QDQ39847.1 hypothetical protein E3226_005285 [Legionella geestiana]STX55120.1 Uncharacterised protein [Legionella geestiana]